MYLLDTHIIYWSLHDSSQLSQNAKEIIDMKECSISIVSLWEMSIKSVIGKLKLNLSCRQMAEIFQNNDIKILNITPEDCDIIQSLPMIHRDPFDRIIIAQAISNNCIIVTKDNYIPQYDINTVW